LCENALLLATVGLYISRVKETGDKEMSYKITKTLIDMDSPEMEEIIEETSHSDYADALIQAIGGTKIDLKESGDLDQNDINREMRYITKELRKKNEVIVDILDMKVTITKE